MANSETKMKNFVGLSRQYYWVPDAQKSTASSSNPLGPFLYSGSLSSGWAEPLIFDLGASYIYYIYPLPVQYCMSLAFWSRTDNTVPGLYLI